MRRNVLLFLSLTSVFVPLGVLVYFGVIHLAQERTLALQENLRRMETDTSSRSDRVSAGIQKSLENLERMVRDNEPSGRAESFLTFRKTLDTEFFQGRLKGIAVLNSKGKVMSPFLSAVVPVSPLGGHPPDATAEFARRLGVAQRAEFQKNDFLEAAASYNVLRNETKDERWRCVLGFSMALCWIKADRLDYAERALVDVRKNSGVFRDGADQPLALLSGIQLAALYKKTGRAKDRALVLSALAEDLFQNPWRLSSEKRDFFLSETRTWNDVVRKAETKRKEEESLFRSLQDTVLPSFLRLFSEASVVRSPLVIDAGDHALFYVPLSRWRSFDGDLGGVLLVSDATFFQLFTKACSGGIPLTSQRPTGGFSKEIPRVFPPLWVEPGARPDALSAWRKKTKYLWSLIALSSLVVLISLGFFVSATRKERHVSDLKERIVAGVSHDLKTPLSVILLAGEKLTLGRYRTPEEAQELSRSMYISALRLKSYVNDILDLSRAVRGVQKETFKPVLLKEILNGCLALYPETVPFIKRMGDEDVLLLADARALERVFVNIVGNAVKYSPKDRLDICIETKTTGSHATVSVTDRGTGIREEDLPYVFDDFYRASRKQAGSGLGLGIVRHIVERHGGSVKIKSQVGFGTTTTVILPVR